MGRDNTSTLQFMGYHNIIKNTKSINEHNYQFHLSRPHNSKMLENLQNKKRIVTSQWADIYQQKRVYECYKVSRNIQMWSEAALLRLWWAS